MKKQLFAILLAVGILLAPSTVNIASDDDPGRPQSVENDISQVNLVN